MKKFHWVRLYLLLLGVVLFATAAFAGIKGYYVIYREVAMQKAAGRSRQGIADASDLIIDRISQIAKDAGCRQYDSILELINKENEAELSEGELENYFRRGYVNLIKDEIGTDSTGICENLNMYLSGSGIRNVYVYNNNKTVIDEETDEGGNVISLWIRSVTICYDDPTLGRQSDTVSYNIQFPEAVFHAGSDELFSYCMVSRKGIYLTGQTSSVIGDIFAGGHTPEECREAEIAYGETGTYGGLNILSTQLGIRSDTIVCMGDINLNGSFVVFAPNTDRLGCYAQRINEIEGFSRKTNYTLDGEFYPIYAMDEAPLTKYHDAITLADVSLSRLDGISMYYDSDNDGGYEGKYRKLMSDTDIEIRNDFTGIVATPANVIIDNDVNFEGIILSGDRIYAMGNNNIVANAAVARSVIASELESGYGIMVSDYIGGMRAAGLADPDHYVVPYR